MVVATAAQRLLSEHANLSALIEANPAQGPSLVQTLLDLTHAQRWSHLCVWSLPESKSSEAQGNVAALGADESLLLGNALICGLRPEEKAMEAVWPCSYGDTLNVHVFQKIFAALDDLDANQIMAASKSASQAAHAKTTTTMPPLARNHFIFAVHAQDATVVYYKMARGLVKPVN